MARVLKLVLEMVIAGKGRGAALTDVDTVARHVNILFIITFSLDYDWSKSSP